jgi:creatinine amidohydrolase
LLQVAARELRRQFGLRTFTMHVAIPVDQGAASSASSADEAGMGVHAGATETSMMLHLRPDLVNMALDERNVPEHLSSYRHVGFGRAVSFGWLSNDFGPSGVIGDPTLADATFGKRAVEEAIESAAAALREVATFTP